MSEPTKQLNFNSLNTTIWLRSLCSSLFYEIWKSLSDCIENHNQSYLNNGNPSKSWKSKQNIYVQTGINISEIMCCEPLIQIIFPFVRSQITVSRTICYTFRSIDYILSLYVKRMPLDKENIRERVLTQNELLWQEYNPQ